MEAPSSELITKQLTPLMQQYAAIKHTYADALILFQVGDFYELFFDDAKQAATYLGIALTKRGHINGEPIPLCGVPVHALDHYLAKLVRGGFKVAICDQLEPATPGKVVERGVTRVLTPGTLTDDKLLDPKSASYLLSFFPLAHQWGLLFGELLTAQLYATVLPYDAHKILESEIIRFFPDEVLLPDSGAAKPFQAYFKGLGYYTTLVPAIADEDDQAGATRGWMNRQFTRETVALLNSQQGIRNALYGLHGYLKKNQESALDQFKTINFYRPEDYLILDPATQKNLELIKGYDGTSKNSLFEFIDRAVTSMGSRTLKKWLVRPLISQDAIEQRYDVIEHFIKDSGLMHDSHKLLREMGDVERVIGRIALRRASIHDYLMLANTLSLIPEIKKMLHAHQSVKLLNMLDAKIADFEQLEKLLRSSLNVDSTKDWIIQQGYDANLDRLRELVHNSQSKILELELREQQATGIQSLKVRFNGVFGYYIEVTKANLDSVPVHYIRQQTLVGRERFSTPELKTLQAEIMTAQHQIGAVEQAVFERIKAEVFNYLSSLRHLAQALAYLDALASLSKSAYEYNFVRPTLHDNHDIIINQGRHPVVAHTLNQQFIPNDTELTDNQSLWIITGPNMGGKSTYLRQNALICIMAQCGSFVPARSANLPILDRIFTRIGAGDNVTQGKSTFLMEMEETALICTKATNKSLLILDEVGRGTSTYDGLAIAQAVVEFIYTHIGARCLFATHYHELTKLQEQFPGICSYHAASKQTDAGIVFLYKMIKGQAAGSFGIEVAKLAGLPPSIIARSQEILESLTDQMPQQITQDHTLHVTINTLHKEIARKNELIDQLTHNLDELSPRAAYDLLWNLKLQKDQ